CRVLMFWEERPVRHSLQDILISKRMEIGPTSGILRISWILYVKIYRLSMKLLSRYFLGLRCKASEILPVLRWFSKIGWAGTFAILIWLQTPLLIRLTIYPKSAMPRRHSNPISHNMRPILT